MIQGHICRKNFYEDLMTFSRGTTQIVENVLFRYVEESFNKFLDPDPEADDFQNLTTFLAVSYTHLTLPTIYSV